MGFAFDSYRTRAAKLAGAASALKRACHVQSPFSLAFLSDARRVPNPDLVARVLPPRSAFILRDYHAQHREGLARYLQTICAHRKVLFLVGGDIALARRIGADGVHLPRWVSVVASDLEGLIVSAACHNNRELARAGALGANIIFLSAAFETESHPEEPPLGNKEFQMLALKAPCPVLALGGVTEKNAHLLAGPNIAGLAAIGAFMAR